MSETARPRRGGNGATPRADTTTPNLGLVQPEVGASNSTWGNKLNNNFAILDNSLMSNADGATNGAFSVGGLLTAYGGLSATTASVSGPLDVGGLISAYGGLTVSGPASLNGTLSVDGLLTAFNGINAGGTSSMYDLNVNGTESVGGALNVTGPTTLESGLQVGGDIQAYGGINVGAAANFYSTVAVANMGIMYTGVGPGHYIAFGWDGAQLQAYVDGTGIGPVASEPAGLRTKIAELEKQVGLLLNRIRTLEERI